MGEYDAESNTYRLEEDVTVCQDCGYTHKNTQEAYIHLDIGHYCPKCGSQFEEGDRFTRVEVIEFEDDE